MNASAHGADSKTAIVIDDDLNLIIGYKMMLEREGYSVLIAKNAEEGRTRLRKCLGDELSSEIISIVTCFHVSGEDGAQMISEVLDERSDARDRLHVVFLTLDREGAQEALKREGVDFPILDKPANPDDIIAALARQFESALSAAQ